jgi:hypothetical protein
LIIQKKVWPKLTAGATVIMVTRPAVNRCILLNGGFAGPSLGRARDRQIPQSACHQNFPTWTWSFLTREGRQVTDRLFTSSLIPNCWCGTGLPAKGHVSADFSKGYFFFFFLLSFIFCFFSFCFIFLFLVLTQSLS